MSEVKDYDEHKPGTTQDEQLLESPGPDEFTHTDTWRVFRIMGEFVTGFDELATSVEASPFSDPPEITLTILTIKLRRKLPPCWPAKGSR